MKLSYNFHIILMVLVVKCSKILFIFSTYLTLYKFIANVIPPTLFQLQSIHQKYFAIIIIRALSVDIFYATHF